MPRWCGSRPKASRRSACAISPRDAGVNHRAVYRHFPDKLSLLALVAERGWQRLGQRLKKSTAGKAPGEPALVAASVGFFLFAREFPESVSPDGRRAHQSSKASFPISKPPSSTRCRCLRLALPAPAWRPAS